MIQVNSYAEFKNKWMQRKEKKRICMKRLDIRQSDHNKIECIFYALSLIVTRRYWFHSIASIKRLDILLLFHFLRYLKNSSHYFSLS